MVAHKKRAVKGTAKKASKKTVKKSKSSAARSKKRAKKSGSPDKSNTRITASTKKVGGRGNSRIRAPKKRSSKKSSNTRISSTRKSRKAKLAAKKGWKTRRLNKIEDTVQSVHQQYEKSREIRRLRQEMRKMKAKLDYLEDERKESTIRKKLKPIVRKVIQSEFEKALTEKYAKGLVETFESKVMRRIADAYYIAVTEKDHELLEQEMELIMDEFDLSEAEAWHYFRLDYEERSG